MVRFYDPSRTDPSLKFIRGVQSFISQKQNQLSEDEIQAAIKTFLKDLQYKKMFEEYIEKRADFPDIVVKNNCPTKRFLMSPYTDFKYYRSYYDQDKNEIGLCSNFLSDVLDLKENLDRELVMAYDRNIKQVNLHDNESFASSQIRACKKQYDNFSGISDELKRTMVSSCSKYLMKVC